MNFGTHCIYRHDDFKSKRFSSTLVRGGDSFNRCQSKRRSILKLFHIRHSLKVSPIIKWRLNFRLEPSLTIRSSQPGVDNQAVVTPYSGTSWRNQPTKGKIKRHYKHTFLNNGHVKSHYKIKKVLAQGVQFAPRRNG